MACLFCDFISGKRTNHVNGLPFIPLYKTKHALSFLSMETPAHEDGHTLIIPLKHFKSIEGLPKKILLDLMEHVKKVMVVTRRLHQACNVLLNDGKAAGQYVPHVHVHVIPRDPRDNIGIEIWKERKMSASQFRILSLKLKKEYYR